MSEIWDETSELTRASWGVLRKKPLLGVFPFLGILGALAAAFPLLSVSGTLELKNLPSVNRVILSYITSYFIILFFNCCIAAAAAASLRGEPVSLIRSIGMAAARLPQILLWSLFSGTVGALLTAIDSSGKEGGSILGIFSGLLHLVAGLAWRWATLLVLPIIIIEGQFPVRALGTSAALFRKTWGQEFIGNIRVSFPILIPLFLCGMAIVLSMSVSKPLALPLFLIGVVGFVSLIILRSVVSVIFKVALYEYATSKAASDLPTK